MYTPAECIRRKRDGARLDDAVLRRFVDGVASGEVGDAQLGAFLMAVYLRGMDDGEQAALTLAMRDSGAVLSWPGLDGPVVDKHSTGGVGDLVSLVLAPLLAACGAWVPMISGRGLGHTGGTLDKLESIPGIEVTPDLERLKTVVREAGCAIVGQGPELAPADRRLYAARDVTATVSCTPLIVSSILSKKLAEGLDSLVIDVKVGNGAIARDEAAARELGSALCAVAAAAGLPCRAWMTDMNQPLAPCAGNALEVAEAIRFLRGDDRDRRLEEVVLTLSAELLMMSGLAGHREEALQRLRVALDDGTAAERFAAMVRLQGGPGDLLERAGHYLPTAPVRRDLCATNAGYVSALDTRDIGRTVSALGGGRLREEDVLDPAVGISGLRRIGDRIEAGDPLATVHAADEGALELALKRLHQAIGITAEPVPGNDVLLGRLGPATQEERS